jgi:L-fucose mutarotase/ribose pyranase (RbsD/FucU family)
MLKMIDPPLDADVLEELGAGGRGNRPAMRETYCVIATGKPRLEAAPCSAGGIPPQEGAGPVLPTSNAPRLHMPDMLAR